MWQVKLPISDLKPGSHDNIKCSNGSDCIHDSAKVRLRDSLIVTIESVQTAFTITTIVFYYRLVDVALVSVPISSKNLK